ncbi:hypothetical protein CKO31_08345 [Thiohalocapsa halophila]|jgi:hypothetical protein|uniref:DUF2281 domain-containing protein n=1 Tax=Thiohalocapsa halophila TaxID=69359 RepID=A0ABS1CFR5_9GAMM|nr:hypothetical protein [Thiohalocapsa halophila]MBK1630752.1 hypothetical protein [Thiohalocapsa halophila]
MKSVEQLKSEIENLPPAELRELAQWLAERDADAWDEQIERDAAAGSLDFLVEEAREEQRRGKLREL